jgi:hypothetical protein
MGTIITTIGSFITEQTGTAGTTLILDTPTTAASIETSAIIVTLFTTIVLLFIIIDIKKLNIVKKLK